MNEIVKKVIRRLIWIVVLASAAFLIYLPSELGSALTIPPDSSEYSICLANLFEHGRFGFTLNGEWYPSRYAPWFSLLCLTPAYLLSGGDVLCMHWAILAFALLLLVAIWKMGSLCGMGRLAILPPILLMFVPDFLFYCRIAMTEIPYVTLFVILALVFVKFANHAQPSIGFCLCAGLLVAWSGLVRPTGFAIAIPFGIVVLVKHTPRWKRKLVLLLALGIPIVVAQFANLGYNWVVFGSPFRSGYNYWCAVPLDFPNLAFNLRYVVPFVEYYLDMPIVQITMFFLFIPLMLSVYAIAKKDFTTHRTLLPLVGYVVVHFLVLMCLYLGYYWADTRFFLSITISSVLLFFVAINAMMSKFGFALRTMLMLVVFALCLAAVINIPTRYLSMSARRSVWLAEAQITGAVLPSNAIVIHQGDPNVLDYFGFKDNKLVLFPLRREFNYVKYMTSPKRITHLVQNVPKSVTCMIIPELVDSGVCKLPFPNVFMEEPSLIHEYIAQGKRVFFQRGCLRDAKDLDGFKSRIESMGLSLKLFGVWNVPGISPNPIRHLYDKLLFPGYAMDSRPEITVAYYEVVVAEELSNNPLERGDVKKGDKQ